MSVLFSCIFPWSKSIDGENDGRWIWISENSNEGKHKKNGDIEVKGDAARSNNQDELHAFLGALKLRLSARNY